VKFKRDRLSPFLGNFLSILVRGGKESFPFPSFPTWRWRLRPGARDVMVYLFLPGKKNLSIFLRGEEPASPGGTTAPYHLLSEGGRKRRLPRERKKKALYKGGLLTIPPHTRKRENPPPPNPPPPPPPPEKKNFSIGKVRSGKVSLFHLF